MKTNYILLDLLWDFPTSRKVLGYAFSGLIFAGFLYAGNKAILFTKKNNMEWLKPV